MSKGFDYSAFCVALKSGVAKAEEAIRGMHDGGTCNFDAVFVSTGLGQVLSRQSKKFERMIESIEGVSCFHTRHSFRRGYIVNTGLGGQAYTRTEAAKIVCDTLRDNGFDVGMWYQMD